MVGEALEKAEDKKKKKKKKRKEKKESVYWEFPLWCSGNEPSGCGFDPWPCSVGSGCGGAGGWAWESLLNPGQ